MYVPIIYAPADPATVVGNSNGFFIFCICIFGLLLLMIIPGYFATRKYNQRKAEAEDNLHFENTTYVEDRLRWLNDAATSLLSIPREDTPSLESERLMAWKKVNERYDGAEDMLRRYCAWRIRKRAAMRVVDWDEAGMVGKRRDFCLELNRALRLRKEVVLLWMNCCSEEREDVEKSARVFLAEGWGEVIGYENLA